MLFLLAHGIGDPRGPLGLSMSNQALNELSRASAALSSETRRKALTNDSSIACLSTAWPLIFVGRVMPARRVRCASISRDIAGDRCRVAR